MSTHGQDPRAFSHEFSQAQQSLLRLIETSDVPEQQPVADSPRPSQTPEADLLDAYSQAVIHVVETVAPAVVGVMGGRDGQQGGQGSGFLLTPDGFALTNSHVVHGRRPLLMTTQDGDRLDAELIGDDLHRVLSGLPIDQAHTLSLLRDEQRHEVTLHLRFAE